MQLWYAACALCRAAVRELAARRAREAIRLAQQRLRDASVALPDDLVPLIKIINYGDKGGGGGTARPGASATLPTSPTRARPGMSGALRQFSGLRTGSPSAELATDPPEGPLSALLGEEPCVPPGHCRVTRSLYLSFVPHVLLPAEYSQACFPQTMDPIMLSQQLLGRAVRACVLGCRSTLKC